MNCTLHCWQWQNNIKRRAMDNCIPFWHPLKLILVLCDWMIGIHWLCNWYGNKNNKINDQWEIISVYAVSKKRKFDENYINMTFN